MTVHSSGTTLKFSEIAEEFGFPPNKNFGAYRVNQTVGDRTWSLDSGVPSSGTIKFSDLYDKTLNVVVDITGGETTSSQSAEYYYNNNGVVIGGFKSFPDSQKTKKVYHLIRQKIGNGFNSGNWDNNTLLLQFIITGSGSLYGYGGRGGDGANIDESAPSAGDSFFSGRTNNIRYGAQSGGHALLVSYDSTVIVESGGILAGGGGGGGGGGYQYNNGPDARGAGYGGGGGAGYPAGSGGSGGFVNERGRNGNVCQGGPGAPGTLTTAGIGGPQSGGNRTSPCGLTGGGNGGYGGDGASLGSGGNNGENKNTSGGSGGSSGNSVYHPGVTISLINYGTVLGPY